MIQKEAEKSKHTEAETFFKLKLVFSHLLSHLFPVVMLMLTEETQCYCITSVSYLKCHLVASSLSTGPTNIYPVFYLLLSLLHICFLTIKY